MRNKINLCLAVLLVLGLCACGMNKEKLGLSKKAPDEFMVSPRPPLSLPPEYNLRPVVEPQPQTNLLQETLSPTEKKLLARVENKS